MGRTKGRREGRGRRKKLKVFWTPLPSLGGYTVCVCVPLIPRQRPHHCFCQPQQEPFKRDHTNFPWSEVPLFEKKISSSAFPSISILHPINIQTKSAATTSPSGYNLQEPLYHQSCEDCESVKGHHLKIKIQGLSAG